MAEDFRRSERHPPLEPGSVHVWRVAIPGPAEARAGQLAYLLAQERSRADRFRFARDRERYVAARATLRRLLGAYLNMGPADVGLEYGSHGKPELAAARSGPALHFNLSRRGDYMLCAFCRDRRVGVDIEHVRDVPEAPLIARSHFTPAEARLVCDVESAEARENFFRIWTRKEAVIKAVGFGLSMPLNEFEVTSGTVEPVWCGVHVASQPRSVFAVRDLALAEGYRGALAVEGDPVDVMLWHTEC